MGEPQDDVGADYTNIESDGVDASGIELPPGARTSVRPRVHDAAATSCRRRTKTLGLYVQEQAGIRDRLFLTVAVRTDQNSAFGTNFQRVFYPKAERLVDHLATRSFFPHIRLARTSSACAARTARPACSRAPRRRSDVQRRDPAINIGHAGQRDRHRHARPHRQRARQPGPQAEKSAEFEIGLRDAPVQQPRELRLHVLQQEDARRADRAADRRRRPAPSATSVAAQPRLGPELRPRGDRQRDAARSPRASAGTSRSPRSHNTNKILVARHRRDRQAEPDDRHRHDARLGRASRRTGGSSGRYTYTDANGDGIITPDEVHVDPNVEPTWLLAAARHLLDLERLRSASAASCASTSSSTTRAGSTSSTTTAQFYCSELRRRATRRTEQHARRSGDQARDVRAALRTDARRRRLPRERPVLAPARSRRPR